MRRNAIDVSSISTITIIGVKSLCFTLSHARIGDTTGVCATCSVLIMHVVILFPRQTRVLFVIK